MTDRDDTPTPENSPDDEPTADQSSAPDDDPTLSSGDEPTADRPAPDDLPTAEQATDQLGTAPPPPPPPPDSPQPAAAAAGGDGPGGARRFDFRRLFRSKDDKVIGGVAGGLGQYFGLDPVIFRIAFVALSLVGGAGVLLYLAALLLVPQGEDQQPAIRTRSDSGGRIQLVTVVGVIVLACAAFAVLVAAGAVIGWILFPLAFLAVAGLLAFWAASGKRPDGTPMEIAKRAVIGLGILTACGLLALAGGWAAGTGGGTVAAILVIGSGVVLVTGAFYGGARWFILPALSLGMAAAFVAAAGINLDGGVGKKDYRPATVADVHAKYEIGVGELIVDLRDAKLPAGDTRIEMDVGIGHGLLVVPRNVCVSTEATAGMGAIEVFDRDSGGIDVDFVDERVVSGDTPRVVLVGDVGLGAIEVTHRRPIHDWHDSEGPVGLDEEPGNDACVGGSTAAVGSGARG